MTRTLLGVLVALLSALTPAANAHGALAINELETLAIRDFEGQEDSFAWEGFEIWDVYVGEGYNDSYDSDGVYFKVNLAGDGTQRPTGGSAWTLTFRFNVDDEAFEREILHDGSTVSTSFESLEWMIADGNVFQLKAWVPVAGSKGRNVTDIVILSAVDGEPRDVAPGGIYPPGGAAEVPVSAPGTPIFPPLGEGRIVEAVPLTGPEKLLDVAFERTGDGRFHLTVGNPLAEQGQHVALRADPAAGWDMNATPWGGSLDGKASMDLDLTVAPRPAAGSELKPLRIDIISDIGGRRTLYAHVGPEGIGLVDDPALAMTSTLESAPKDTPMLSLATWIAAVGIAAALRRRW